ERISASGFEHRWQRILFMRWIAGVAQRLSNPHLSQISLLSEEATAHNQSPTHARTRGSPMSATIDDTYAEAFRSIYASVLITARDCYWLDKAVSASTGNASSTILCDCEAGLDRHVDASETPDGRPGAVVQFHVPRFLKDREARLERVVLVRVSQNVMTCPT